MTLAQTIVEVDLGDAEAARLRAIYEPFAASAEAVHNLPEAAIWRRRQVVCDAIRDALRRARDSCEELS